MKQSHDMSGLSPLTAISSIDGRYRAISEPLAALFSEYGLFRHRLIVEIRWLQRLMSMEGLPLKGSVSSHSSARRLMDQIISDFTPAQAEKIKDLEKITRHDVKALEYYLREHLGAHRELASLVSFIHFGCTSEDINNMAWSLIVRDARETILMPQLKRLIEQLTCFAEQWAAIPMLARTHGQAASPTTLGKEFANFAYRLHQQSRRLQRVAITAKMNGAVGNYNACRQACPTVDWPQQAQQFVESMGLSWMPYTTQIEPHDSLAELLSALTAINAIMIDCCRDLWGYIALDYLRQKVQGAEVGSSTMPHKVNPIDFENAEGNAGLASALAQHLSVKLPISRWQRDLSDSSSLRSLGSVFAHSLIALSAWRQGLKKISPNEEVMKHDLNKHWEVLTEAIQTNLRHCGDAQAYEKTKAGSRGQKLDAAAIKTMIERSGLSAEARKKLLACAPENYTGYAELLAKRLRQELNK